MRTVTAVLKSKSNYSQSRRHETDKVDKESAEDYDRRTWREHCTANAEGIVCIPGMALKKALDATSSKLGEKVPGKRGRTWASYFRGGIIPSELMFPLYRADGGKRNAPDYIRKDQVPFIDVWCSATGRPGGAQVSRRFPEIMNWEAAVSFDVIDNSLPKDIVEHTLTESGLIVGIGRFRPENGGFNGRYEVVPGSVHWSNGIS